MKSLLIIFLIFLNSSTAYSSEMENAVEFFNKKDFTKVIEIIRPAVERKDPSALNQMGSFYEEGLGVTKDLSQAFRFYKEAADLGDANGQFNIGLMYQYGRYVKTDINTAISWYKKSSANGNDDAAYNLGFLYTNDQRIKRDITSGMRYYQMAFSKGNALAAYNLGVIHSEGQFGFPVNKKMAAVYYANAALKDHPKAFHNLAAMYQNGEGVIQNYQESIRFNVLAIKKGVADSMTALSAKYILGIGVPVNMKLAQMWALLAKNNNAENTETLLKVSADRLNSNDLIESQNLAIQCQKSRYEICSYPKFITEIENR